MRHSETYFDCHLFAGLLHILPVTLWPGIMVWQMMPEIWICMQCMHGFGPFQVVVVHMPAKNTWCVEGSKSTRFKVFWISTSTFSFTTQTTHQTGRRNGSVSNKMMVAIIYTRRVGHLFHLCPLWMFVCEVQFMTTSDAVRVRWHIFLILSPLHILNSTTRQYQYVKMAQPCNQYVKLYLVLKFSISLKLLYSKS